jgi:uncharacterized membrane protein
LAYNLLSSLNEKAQLVDSRHTDNYITIVLSPNRSATWGQTKSLLLLMALVVIGIAIVWSLVGAWLILPFAGLEVGLLALFMYKGSYASYQQQVITLDDKQIKVEMGVHYPKYNASLTRSRTYLAITEAETEYELIQLCLQDDTQQIPIGQFLNQQERLLAREALQKEGLLSVSNCWWRAS